MTDPKIRHVKWRGGRPRFEPSVTLRALGYKGEDLKTDDGSGGRRWMTAGEALDWSNALQKQIALARRKTRARATGRMPAAPPLPAPALKPGYPVSRLFDDWLNVRQNPSIADLADNTVSDYRKKANTFRNHLPDVWEAEAEALTKPICVGLYDALRAKLAAGDNRTGIAAAAGAMRILGIALQWAIDRGRFANMHVNPAHKLKMKTAPPRIRFAAVQELKALTETADEMAAHDMADMFVLAVWSGQRQNDRLNFQLTGREGGRITLRQGKTKVIVSLPEAPELRKRMNAAELRRKTAGVISPYLILNEEDWRPFEASRYRRRFGDIRRAAARRMPSLKTLRDQDFRDTAVTWLALADCTIPQICAITGHSFKTAHEILKHYLAMNPEMADSAIAKLVEWYKEAEAKK